MITGKGAAIEGKYSRGLFVVSFREYEEIYDVLQGDIDALEKEKTELKERLKNLSKKTLFEGLSRQSSQPGSPSSGGMMVAGSATSVKDSPMLLQQVWSKLGTLSPVVCP